MNDKEKRAIARLCSVFSFVTALSPAAVVEFPLNAGFLCDKAAVLGAVINERPCIMQWNSEHF